MATETQQETGNAAKGDTKGCYYEDTYLAIVKDNDGKSVLTIQMYYFSPFGTRKTIKLDSLKSITEHPMDGMVSGRGRMWGTSNFKYWLNLDKGRSSKSRLFVLRQHGAGNWGLPVVAPDDPDAFLEAIRQQGKDIEITKSDTSIWC